MRVAATDIVTANFTGSVHVLAFYAAFQGVVTMRHSVEHELKLSSAVGNLARLRHGVHGSYLRALVGLYCATGCQGTRYLILIYCAICITEPAQLLQLLAVVAEGHGC